MGTCGQFAGSPTPPRIRLTDWKLHPAGTFIVYRRPRQNWETERRTGNFYALLIRPDRYPAIRSSSEISQASWLKAVWSINPRRFISIAAYTVPFRRTRSMIIALLRDPRITSNVNYNDFITIAYKNVSTSFLFWFIFDKYKQNKSYISDLQCIR